MKWKITGSGVFFGISAASLGLTVWWCRSLGSNDIERFSTALLLCASSFLVGSLFGFIFTIFGDEVEPLGKIRDAALIAVTSGAAGIGLARAQDLGHLAGSIHILGAEHDQNPQFVILLTLTYFIVGFYFMYLLRKLVLNQELAKSKAAMDRLAQNTAVSTIAMRISSELSPDLLLGRQYIDDDDVEGKESLKDSLFSANVNEFLKGCEDDIKSGSAISGATLAMAARLQYYRIYFDKEGTAARAEQQQKALAWISRALVCDPFDQDLQIKLADVFGLEARYDKAVSIMERLERNENAPQYVQQWLGYYLLFIEGREGDAITQSLQYHERFRTESSGLFNAACGYAQLYKLEIAKLGPEGGYDSGNRTKSLDLLSQAILIEPSLKKLAKEHSDEGDSFDCLKSDTRFIALTAEFATMDVAGIAN